MSDHTAREIVAARHLSPVGASWRFYEVTPPMVDDNGEKHSVVMVSASNVVGSGPETYIFPARRKGDVFGVADWLEMPGSFRGALDHDQALDNAGYTVVDA